MTLLEELLEHCHQHGEHQHVHRHGAGELAHEHGWHATAEHCNGDDSFGVELNAPPPTLGKISPDQGVYVPYVGAVHERTWESITEQGFYPELIDLEGSQYNYWEMWRQLWSFRLTFTNVEHDIELPRHTLQALVDCEHEVCVHDYEVYAGRISDAYGEPGALGCIKVHLRVMDRFPNLVENIVDRSWPKLDSQILAGLRSRGVKVHRHHPDVIHHHHYERPT